MTESQGPISFVNFQVQVLQLGCPNVVFHEPEYPGGWKKNTWYRAVIDSMVDHIEFVYCYRPEEPKRVPWKAVYHGGEKVLCPHRKTYRLPTITRIGWTAQEAWEAVAPSLWTPFDRCSVSFWDPWNGDEELL